MSYNQHSALNELCNCWSCLLLVISLTAFLSEITRTRWRMTSVFFIDVILKVLFRECQHCSYCKQPVLRRCSKYGWRTFVPPGRLVQRYSLGTVGAPAASNPHSCSPGLEPLQSPPVPAAIGSACPGVAVGERSINDNNIQHADLGSDAKAWPSPTQDQNLDRSQDRDAWCSLGEQKADFGGGGGVCVWLKHSGLLFTSCLVPHHHWLEGGGGGYYAAGWGEHVFGSGRSVFGSLEVVFTTTLRQYPSPCYF